MNKNIFLGVGIVLVLCVALFIFLSFFEKTTPQEEPTENPYPTATGTASVPADTFLNLTTPHGSVRVHNFLKNPETIQDPVNAGYYYVGKHIPFDGTPLPASVELPFVVSYIAPTQFFNIVLYEEPLATSRLKAEGYLMQVLGLTETEMCALHYSLSVPNFVSPLHAGESLGFSFCTGSVVLP